MHSQPPGTDADAILGSIQSRVRHIATLVSWQERATDSAASLHQQLLQAQADLARARAVIDIQQRIIGIDLTDPPPPQLVTAWRAGSPGYVPIQVLIDDVPVTLIIHGPPREADLVREAYAWQRVQQVWREVHHELRGVA
ncbi:hypothetical protein AB0395_26475 [Streptosporangium sp. NPDC051023]|uniref:hypothetical protein n=1 Tax=Streptosporangium sp. NPDC051023 TaxID=3155410 RepID=UPI00345057C0